MKNENEMKETIASYLSLVASRDREMVSTSLERLPS